MAREYPSHPLIGVGAVILRDGRILLVRRAKPPAAGEWSLPGGAQELGETVFEAAAREVHEETGVIVRPFLVVDVIDLIDRDPADGRIRWHYTLIDVLASWQRGEPLAAHDACEARWVHLDDIHHWVQRPAILRVIARARQLHATPLPEAGE